MSRKELIEICKERGLKGYSTKTKAQLNELIGTPIPQIVPPIPQIVPPIPQIVPPIPQIVPPIDIDINAKFKFIDLFCGIGGFHQALTQLGGKCVFASDIDANCRDTYEENYGIRPHGDITKVDVNNIPDFDILTGGFPCQSFSNSGKKGGFTDKRGQLYENILAIALVKKPSYMFLENVKHIKKIENGDIFKQILFRINETGYHVETFELSPHQLGVPQQRERILFVCIRTDIYDKTKELDMTPPENVFIDVDGILEKDKDKTCKYKISVEHENILTVWDEMIQHMDVGQTLSPTILCNEFNHTYSDNEFTQLPAWKQDYITKNKPIYKKYKDLWDAWLIKHRTILSKREIYGKMEWQAGVKTENDSIFNHFIQLRQSGIRVKKSKYFPTLVAIVQTPIYAKERRYITPRECARLQSFPDSFKLPTNDKVAYKQFGNAVNVKVVHYVMSRTLQLYGFV
jgi:DNA (cytosine-5)-methyltransferase 1